MKQMESMGFQFVVKPGPFIHSELNVGGLPDLVCPKYSPETPAARRSHGRPVIWEYDATPLPAPFDEGVDALCKEWLNAVHDVVAPFAREGGPLIGFQMNDETIYCMSNSPPWHIGYEASGMRFYHGLLADRYGDIATYNKLHGTNHDAFAFVLAPQLPDTAAGAVRSREDMLKFVDWAELQWRYRRDLYVRYTEYMGVKKPYLTNYAGITPPIQENVPDLQEDVQEQIPADFLPLYPEWWFAHNRIETDAADYHYGMISWLGVASYDRGVFDRYINTARRARGINMEENWGFGTLYDAKSRLPADPVLSNARFRGRRGHRLQHLLRREYRLLGRDPRPHHEEAAPHVPLARPDRRARQLPADVLHGQDAQRLVRGERHRLAAGDD